MIIGLFQSSVSAKSVLKSYRYDYNPYYDSSMNFHGYRYKDIPEWSHYTAILSIKLAEAGTMLVMRY